MRKLFLYAALLSPLALMAQAPVPQNPTFTLKSTLSKIDKPTKVYLLYRAGANNFIDSVYTANGAFTFTGPIQTPTNAIMVVDHQNIGFSKLDRSADALSFYLERGEITINGTDSIAKAQIIGSPINAENIKLTAVLKPINEKAEQIYKEAAAATPVVQTTAEFRNGIQAKLKTLQTQREQALKDFIETHPKSYLSLMALSSLGGPSADPQMLLTLFNKLDVSVQSTEPGMQLRRSITELTATAIGAAAPDFTQPDAEGKMVKLSSFKGKYVLIDFWASWCGPCREENPNVVKAYNKYKVKNFTILGVSLDRPNGKNDWLNAIKNDGLAWTQVSDLKFWQNEAAMMYGVRAIPQNFLIDPDGKIIAKNLRGEDLENKLSEIFGKI